MSSDPSNYPVQRVPATVPAVEGGESMSVDPTQLALSMWSSLDMRIERDADILMQCLDGTAVKLSSMINVPIRVRDVLVHATDSVDDDTGEVRHLRRIVLITPEGDLAACCSEGVWRSLRVLIARYGPPPWQSMTVVPIQREFGGGKRMFSLRVEPVKTQDQVTSKKGK